MPANKTSAISVRVPDDVKAAVEKAAADDGRSVSSYVERVIAAHLRETGHLSGGKPPSTYDLKGLVD